MMKRKIAKKPKQKQNQIQNENENEKHPVPFPKYSFKTTQIRFNIFKMKSLPQNLVISTAYHSFTIHYTLL